MNSLERFCLHLDILLNNFILFIYNHKWIVTNYELIIIITNTTIITIINIKTIETNYNYYTVTGIHIKIHIQPICDRYEL